MKYKWANWEKAETRPVIEIVKCDKCDKQAVYLAIAETNDVFDTDLIVIKARCEEHFNKKTQKSWLKKWRNKNCIKDL